MFCRSVYIRSAEITGEAAVPGMQFLIASITKTFTATAVLKLAEEGKLSLEDPIDTWLPSDLAALIPGSSNITIRQLLDHTSGIADYDEMAIIFDELKDPMVPAPYSKGIERGINASPLYPPGTNYTYSNVNYLLLTMIIDKAAGTSFEEYLNQSVLQPAGLNHTYLKREQTIDSPSMSADMIDENGSVQAYGSLYVIFDRGAGDIVSTTEDLNTFHQALREGKIINNASVTDMMTNTPQSKKTKNGFTSGYGLGYGRAYDQTRNITLEGHSGGYPGSFSFMYYCPERDAYIAINVNDLDETSKTLQNIISPLLKNIDSA
jgi:D-alanyl-D-alanine carboxypeptidase